jgi:UDP:flavonoid glycosyltransferase YjiC (YdhE family)
MYLPEPEDTLYELVTTAQHTVNSRKAKTQKPLHTTAQPAKEKATLPRTSVHTGTTSLLQSRQQHTHTCGVCGGQYMHSHLISSEKHSHVGSEQCPFCGDNKKSTRVAAPPKTKHRVDVPTPIQFIDFDTSDQGAPAELLSELGPDGFTKLVSDDWTGLQPEDAAGSKPTTSIIRFTRQGRLIAPTDKLQVCNQADIQNVAEVCGYSALEYTLGDMVNYKAMCSIVGKTGDFSDEDIIKYAEKIGVNVIVVSKARTMLTRQTNSWEFATILHANVVDADIDDHWMVGSVQQVQPLEFNRVCHPDITNKLLNTTCQALLSKNMNNYDRSLLTDDEIVMIQCIALESIKMIGTSAQIKTPDWQIKVVDGTPWLTDNQALEHDLVRHKFAQPIPTWAMQIVSTLVNQETYKTGEKVVNIPSGIVNDAEIWLAAEAQDCVNTIRLAYHMNELTPAEQGRHLIYEDFSVQRLKETISIEVSHTKVKSYDVMYLKMVEGVQAISVRPISGTINIPLSSSGSWRHIHMATTRFSIGSTVRKLAAVLTSGTDINNYKALVANSEAVLAPAGWGKSYDIVSKASESDVIIACTSGAISSLKQMSIKQGKNLRVMSLEAATMSRPIAGTMYMDEATLVNLIDGFLATQRAGSLRFFGDEFQIPAIDMRLSAGERHTSSIISQANNTIKHNSTRRLGEPLTQEIAKARPGLVSIAEHQTTFETHWMLDLDIPAITELIVNTKVDLVLCFYKTHKFRLKRAINATMATPGLAEKVHTVHSYQGSEARRVLVVQARLGVSAGIEVDKRYCMSAATRSSDHLVWVTAGIGRPTDPLGERIAGALTTGGASRWWHKLTGRWRKPGPELAYSECAMYSRNDVNRQNRPVDRQLFAIGQKLYQEKFGVAVTLSTDNDDDIVHVRKIIEVARLRVNTAKDITIDYDPTHSVKAEHVALMAEVLKLSGKTDKVNTLPPGQIGRGHKTVYSSRTVVRLLNMITICKLWQADGNVFGFTLEGRYVRALATGHCADCSNLVFVHNSRRLLTITGTEHYTGDRQWMAHSDDWHTRVLCNYLELCNPDHEKLMADAIWRLSIELDLDDKWMALTTFLRRRMADLSDGIVDSIKQLLKWSDARTRTQRWVEAEGLKQPLKLEDCKIPQYSPLSVIIGENSYTVYVSFDDETYITDAYHIRGQRQIHTNCNENQMTSAMINDMRLDPLRGVLEMLLGGGTLVGGKEDNILTTAPIDGLMVPLEKHARLKDQVFLYIQNKLGALEVGAMKEDYEILYLTQNQRRAWANVIKESSPHMKINLHSYTIDESDNEAVPEQLIKYLLNQPLMGNGNYVDYSQRPHLVPLLSHKRARSIPPHNNDSAMVAYECNRPIALAVCRGIANAHEQSQGKESKPQELASMAKMALERSDAAWAPPSSFDSQVQSDTINLNDVWTNFNPGTIISYMLKHGSSKCYLFGPILHTNGDPRFKTITQESGVTTIIDNRTGWRWNINNASLKWLATNSVIAERGINFQPRSIATFLGREIYEISRTHDVRGMYSPVGMLGPGTKVKLEIPYVDYSAVLGVAKPQLIINVKTTWVDERLLRNLFLSTLREGTDFDDLLSYGRVLLHGRYYSMAGITDQYTEQPQEIVDAATGAILLSTDIVGAIMEAIDAPSVTPTSDNPLLYQISRRVDNTVKGLVGSALSLLGLDKTAQDFAQLLANQTTGSMKTILGGVMTNYSKLRARIVTQSRNVYPVGARPAIVEKPTTEFKPWQEKMADLVWSNLALAPEMIKRGAKQGVKPQQDMGGNVNNRKDITKTMLNAALSSTHAPSKTTNQAIYVQTLIGIEELWRTGLRKRYTNEAMLAEFLVDWPTYESVAAWTNGPAIRQVQLAHLYTKYSNQLSEWSNNASNAIHEVSVYESVTVLKKQMKALMAQSDKDTNLNILMGTVGSTGDMRYMVAAAVIISQLGHNVTLLMPSASIGKFSKVIGPTLVAFTFDAKIAIEAWLDAKHSRVPMAERLLQVGFDALAMRDIPEHVLLFTWDLVIGTGITVTLPHIAEANRCPYIELNAMPWFVRPRDSSLLNNIWREVSRSNIQLLNKTAISETRLKLGLSTSDLKDMVTNEVRTIYAYDKAISTETANAGDHIVGYLGWPTKFDQQQLISGDVEMATHVVALGSMTHEGVLNVYTKVVQLTNQHGWRSLLITGYSHDGLSKLLPSMGLTNDAGWQACGAGSIYITNYLPFESNLTSDMIVIHHCGSGTTHAIASIGCPMVAIPVAYDQDYWAYKLRDLGVCRVCHLHQVNTSLEKAIEYADTAEARVRSKELSRQLNRDTVRSFIKAFKSTLTEVGLTAKHNIEPGQEDIYPGSAGMTPYTGPKAGIELIGLQGTEEEEQQYQQSLNLARSMGLQNHLWTEPKWLINHCCGFNDGPKMAIGEMGDMYMISTRRANQGENLQMFAKNHVLATGPVPVDRNRGSPSNATLPYHSHAEILHPLNPTRKPPELVTAAGYPEVIDAVRWHQMAARSTRILTTTEGRLDRPKYLCTCGANSWYTDEGMCGSCIAAGVFPQPGVEYGIRQHRLKPSLLTLQRGLALSLGVDSKAPWSMGLNTVTENTPIRLLPGDSPKSSIEIDQDNRDNNQGTTPGQSGEAKGGVPMARTSQLRSVFNKLTGKTSKQQTNSKKEAINAEWDIILRAGGFVILPVGKPEISPGRYSGIDLGTRITYSPSGSQDCVLACIVEHLKHNATVTQNGAVVQESTLRSRIENWARIVGMPPLVPESQVATWVSIWLPNYAIISQQGTIEACSRGQGPLCTIKISIMNSGEAHAELGEMNAATSSGLKLMAPAMRVEKLSADEEAILGSSNKRSKVVPIIKPEARLTAGGVLHALQRTVSGDTVEQVDGSATLAENIRMRLTSGKLKHIINRSTRNVSLITASVTPWGCICLTGDLQAGKVYLIADHTTQKLHPALAVLTTSRLHLVTTAQPASRVVVLSTGVTAWAPMRTNRNIHDLKEVTYLNVPTMKHCLSRYTGADKIGVGGESKKLIVSTYDNRGHHLFDDQDRLSKQPLGTILLNPQEAMSDVLECSIRRRLVLVTTLNAEQAWVTCHTRSADDDERLNTYLTRALPAKWDGPETDQWAEDTSEKLERVMVKAGNEWIFPDWTPTLGVEGQWNPTTAGVIKSNRDLTHEWDELLCWDSTPLLVKWYRVDIDGNQINKLIDPELQSTHVERGSIRLRLMEEAVHGHCAPRNETDLKAGEKTRLINLNQYTGIWPPHLNARGKRGKTQVLAHPETKAWCEAGLCWNLELESGQLKGIKPVSQLTDHLSEAMAMALTLAHREGRERTLDTAKHIVVQHKGGVIYNLSTAEATRTLQNREELVSLVRTLTGCELTDDEAQGITAWPITVKLRPITASDIHRVILGPYSWKHNLTKFKSSVSDIILVGLFDSSVLEWTLTKGKGIENSKLRAGDKVRYQVDELDVNTVIKDSAVDTREDRVEWFNEESEVQYDVSDSVARFGKRAIRKTALRKTLSDAKKRQAWWVVRPDDKYWLLTMNGTEMIHGREADEDYVSSVPAVDSREPKDATKWRIITTQETGTQLLKAIRADWLAWRQHWPELVRLGLAAPDGIRTQPVEALGIITVGYLQSEDLIYSPQNETRLMMPYIQTMKSDRSGFNDRATDRELTVYQVNFFEDVEAFDQVVMIAPSKGVVRNREMANEIKSIAKATMTDYPHLARPQLTKMVHQEFNAVSRRLMSVETLRKVEYRLDPKTEFNRCRDVYFKEEWPALNRANLEKPIMYDGAAVREWIRTRPGHIAISKELDELLAQGWELNPINRANVHVKLEALLKEEFATQSIRDQALRIIVWQMKGICAIFAPIFAEAKKRIKKWLNRKVLYADGYTPDELSARARLIPSRGTILMEDDLSKQDRQTDEQLIECEMYWYIQAGVPVDIVNFWHQTHKNWRFKGKHTSGILNAMRLTGQATTALGNFIVNLMVHSRLLQEHKQIIILVMVLGDDFLCYSNGTIDSSKQGRISKDYYNMVSKAKHSKDEGTFLQMVSYPTEAGTMEIGADIVRLSMKFEVTNGVSEIMGDNLKARIASYVVMVGNCPEMQEVNQRLQLGLNVPTWYRQDAAIRATMIKRNMSEIEVRNELALLKRNMLRGYANVYHWDVMTDTQIR